ncbi:MAG TPA: hypothetical protein ENG44_00940 [Desulfurococcaceae archaeon]|nr:hypothetical protein [Desulfurococcaceae archaeon]
MDNEYVCKEYPCIHVVVDYSKKIYALFLETSDGDIIHIPVYEVKRALEKVEELSKARFREACGDEIDWLAEERLGALRVEEEE